MSTVSSFQQLFQEASVWARSRGEILTLAHFYVLVLRRLQQPSAAQCTQVIEGIESQILPQLSTRAGGVEGRAVHAFRLEDARSNYHAFIRAHSVEGEPLHATVLRWLLEGTFDDTTQRPCREFCRTAGVLAPAQGADRSDGSIATLGFGRQFAAAGVDAITSEPLVGRDEELRKHHGFLALALNQKRHYLLTGKPGVGKSHFVGHLLARALVGQGAESRGVAHDRRFLLFSRQDFVGSEEENKGRFGRLYSYLQQNPDAVPVIDELEHLLSHSPTLSNHFSSLFGALLAAGGRTFVLVCESGVAMSAPLLQSVNSSPLPPLSPEATQRLLTEVTLPALQKSTSLRLEGSAAGFASALMDHAPRYPERFRPGIAVHLAESAFNRARDRVTLLGEAPLDAATQGDLWGHVVDDCGLSPELFGKNRKDFYERLPQRLTENVKGQDHAVQQLCRALADEANREGPPDRTPRGRFLFVGPPGVGKTELGRGLAEGLGYGQEAFFKFNMSEYSTDAARTRFMGSDPGYVGYNATRTIYHCVRERPSCVILLDEIDRADASIQDILLSILEGEGNDAEGRPVHFSQAIFVMTTNQGEAAVEAAHERVVRGEIDRQQLAASFDDQTLRSLLIGGAVDEGELEMQSRLESQLGAVKARFLEAKDEATGYGLTCNYIDMKETLERLRRTARKSSLDAALLDRIDFVVPFFPVKDPAVVASILDAKLARLGWADCPAATKSRILEQSLAQRQSIRALVRLIKNHRAQETK